MKTNPLLEKLKYHVSGAIERGEGQAIAGIPANANHPCLTGRTDAELVRCYLDWMNNYLTTERFAADYAVTKEEAVLIITAGRDAHEKAVAAHAESYAMARTGYAAEQGGAS